MVSKACWWAGVQRKRTGVPLTLSLRVNSFSGCMMWAKLGMYVFDCTKTPLTLRSSGNRLVGGTMRRMGSKFLSARRVPLALARKPKKVH
jgi:hypothetical protein